MNATIEGWTVPQLFSSFTLYWCLQHLSHHHASSPGIPPLSGAPFSFPQGKFGLDWIRQVKVGHWLWSAYSIVSVKVKPDDGVLPTAVSAGQTFALLLRFLPFPSSLLCYVSASTMYFTLMHTDTGRQINTRRHCVINFHPEGNLHFFYFSHR